MDTFSVWHAIGLWTGTPILHPMTPNPARAQKLMNVATRMMMAGDVERYLHALRLLFALRMRPMAIA